MTLDNLQCKTINQDGNDEWSFFLWLQIIVCWQCTNRCVSAQVYLVLFKVDVYCVLPFFHGKSPSIPPFWEYCFPFFQAFVQQIQVYFGMHHRHFRKKSIVVLKKHVVTCYDFLVGFWEKSEVHWNTCSDTAAWRWRNKGILIQTWDRSTCHHDMVPYWILDLVV